MQVAVKLYRRTYFLECLRKNDQNANCHYVLTKKQGKGTLGISPGAPFYNYLLLRLLGNPDVVKEETSRSTDIVIILARVITGCIFLQNTVHDNHKSGVGRSSIDLDS